MTKAEQDASYPVDPNLKSETSSGPPSGPAANLSPVLEPTVPVDTSNPNHVDTDPHGLEFSESAFLAEVLDEGDCGVWMAATPNTDGLDFNAPLAPELLAPDNSSSSSEESQHTPAFGRCMHCNARGYEYTSCSECDDIFHPIQDSSPIVDSPGIHEEYEEPDPALRQARRTFMASFGTHPTDNDVRDFMASFGPHRSASTDNNPSVVLEEEREHVRAASAPDDNPQVVMEKES